MTPWTAARQASLFFSISQNLLKLMSIELVMPSNHPIFCHTLFLLPALFPSIRVFFSELALCIRCPKYWSFYFNISLSNEYSVDILYGWTGLISLPSKGLSRVFSNTTVQRHQFFGAQLFSCPAFTPVHDYWENHSFDYTNLYPFRFRSFTHFSISLSTFLLLSYMSSMYILDIN